MKRFAALLAGGMLLLMAIGIASGHSDWAKYQFVPVPDYVNVPESMINEDGTLDCCACHWNTNHPGPGKGFCD
ncbi:MAG: hypothetical protein ACOY4H_09610 [Thermodesulfobacteriota bacterium]